MDRSSERRLVENEILFRDANRKVQKQVQRDRLTHKGQATAKLHFYCECSNFHCRDRIVITADEYDKAHKNRKQFITIPTHEDSSVETIVDGNDVYSIVEKYIDPAKLAKA